MRDENAELALEGPPIDDEAIHIFHWWLELHETREDDRAIRWSEIRAYFDLRQLRPIREEIIMLKALEDEYLKYRREQHEAKEAARLKS